ncbi:DUF3606 domain-containing protein [Pseudomonas sp. PCH199]|uniref:DUF3606 domain-containing protein n=1 Tax=unclassified Pseudomonas TaxID=196821 RepID=UPI000BCDD73E|nr:MULTISPECIES: DUF3606 domain-containing protein [unclassified Pseudomonas]MCW8277752.1 DUF3606 domain-containing protein [Pseudomonas sp. PCH199]PAM82145.1 DUF3606 domain-containing protein [Pseudomonas sp. ERMR1:02]
MEQPKLTCGTDEIRINIKDSFELEFWADKFGVSRDEIRSAVKEAGDSLTAVQRKLKNSAPHDASQKYQRHPEHYST